MDWVNYHHLLYFWVVASEGSVTAACARLHLAQPTISSQIKKLEKSIGSRLLERSGRRLVLTETGRLVFEYADEIFTLGRELSEVLKGRRTDRPLRFAVGVPDVLPKLITFRILEPVLALPKPVHLVCVEGALDDLLVEMAAHRLDLVLSDAPASPASSIRVFNHPLGQCGVSVLGTPKTARKLRRGFPKSLDGESVLLPTRNTALRRSLDQWFEAKEVYPTAHRRKLRTTNTLERVNQEMKRRTRVATLFPNEASLLRLVSAVLIEISGEWETGRTYLTMETSSPAQ
jgi:LysR family transcriptional activator of nhaA